MMTFKQILYDVDDGIATITLNRPDHLNAWTPVMESEVRVATELAAEHDAVRVILLTGAGRGFCAGLDMAQLASIPGDSHQARGAMHSGRPLEGSVRRDFQGRFTYFPSVGKPIIGVINGPVAGSGFVLALSCDIRFAGTDAVFTTAFSRRGLVAEHGVSWLLPRLVGPAHALDLLFTARKILPDEALRMGLVNQVFPQSNLLEEARRYAFELARFSSPRSLRIIKRQVWDGLLQGLSEATAIANNEMFDSFRSEDFKEGIAHYREKRTPSFTGH